MTPAAPAASRATGARLPADDVPVLVVGAGITGLALGRALGSRGIASLTLEAEERPGGVVRSRRVGGTVLESGPQRTRLVEPVDRLIGELGLRDRLLIAPRGLPLFVYAAGRLRRVPTDLRSFAATDLLDLRGKLRLLLEPFTGPARPGETVERFATRKVGRQAYERLVEPLYGGIYGSDPAEMPFEPTLGRTLAALGVEGRSLVLGAARRVLSGGDSPPAITFEGGMGELTDALYAERADRIRLGTPAEAMRRGDGAWRVRTGAGEVDAGRVVLTCPADRAAELLRAAAPEAADRLARVRYQPLAVVHLRADPGREGYGYQVARGEGFGTRGVTFVGSLFGRDGVCTAYLGGASAPELPGEPDETLAETAAAEFRAVTGRDAEVLGVSRTRMAAWDRGRAGLEGLTLPEGLDLCAAYESRPGIPGRLRAGERLARRLAADAATGEASGEATGER